LTEYRFAARLVLTQARRGDGDMREDKQRARLAILVGGGPASGINGVIRAATIEAFNAGTEVIGILDGFQHLMLGQTGMVRRLEISDVASIHFERGSILRTSRANPTASPESLARTVHTLSELGISGLMTIGGVNTAFAASQVSKAANGKFRVAHVPKTIDNDLPLPGNMPTVGYETARDVGTHLLLNLREDSQTTGRWYFVGVMGHTAGHLALGAGSAAGATLTVIPEEFPEDRIPLGRVVRVLEGAILKREAMGHGDGVAVIAEGVAARLDPNEMAKIPEVEVEYDPYGNIRLAEIPLATILKREVRRRFAKRGKPRVIVDVAVGYQLRCAPPVAFDIEYTSTLGFAAARFLLSESDVSQPVLSGMLYAEGGNTKVMAFEDMLDPVNGKTRVLQVDINGASYQVARRYMTRLGKGDLEDPHMLSRLADAAGMTPEQILAEFENAI
jgi:6-phosphofructokinase 1